MSEKQGRGGARPGAGRPRGSGTKAGDRMSYSEATRRGAAALARKREIELAKLAGDIIELPLVERALFGLTAETREALLVIPDKLAPLLAAESSETACAELLAAEIEAVLHDLAERMERLDLGTDGPNEPPKRPEAAPRPETS